MATLADMVADIIAETRRLNAEWPAQVRKEISKAIRFYQRERLWFNERRDITFNTVLAQEFYDATANAYVPNLIEIDYIQISQSNYPYPMDMADAGTLDMWTGVPTSGVPTTFSYFQQVLRLYPAPNGVYPIRIAAHIRYPEPATDDEADNHWMTDAEELIRSRAKRNLYLHYMGDVTEGQTMKAAEDEALASLRAESSKRQNIHTLQPSPVM